MLGLIRDERVAADQPDEVRRPCGARSPLPALLPALLPGALAVAGLADAYLA
jgi:hypothetical protein